MQNPITLSNIFFEQQACFSDDASADEAVSEYSRDWPVEYTNDWPADASQLIHGITFDQRIPHGNSIGLSAMYGPESVWSAGQHACLTANLSPASVADFWHSSNPQHLSTRKGIKLGRVRETLTPHSVYTGVSVPVCHPTWEPIARSLSSRASAPNRLRVQSASPPSRHAPYSLGPDIIGRGNLSASIHQCQWIDGESPCITDLTATKNAIAQHLQAVHGIRLKADKTTQVCLWRGCYKPMRRESIPRHVLAVHLGNQVPCPNCELCFARTDSMQRHRRTCHLVKGEHASDTCNDLGFHVES